jgi:hypothetical protein
MCAAVTPAPGDLGRGAAATPPASVIAARGGAVCAGSVDSRAAYVIAL